MFAVAVVALAILTATSAPPTATVSGRVTLNGLRPSGEAMWVTRGGDCPDLIPDDRVVAQREGWLRDVVVSLQPERGTAGAPGPAELAAQGSEVFAIGCGLYPRVQVARPGSLVGLRWGDGNGHRLRAYRDGTAIWDAPRGRQSDLLAVTEPGVLDVRCASSHEWEVAWLYVTAAQHHAVTDAEGRFEIPAVAEGAYTLRAWHAHLGTLEVSVDVEPARPSGLVVAFSGYRILDQMYPGDTVEIED